METAPGLVGVVECGVGQLQCAWNVDYSFVECAYFSIQVSALTYLQ